MKRSAARQWRNLSLRSIEELLLELQGPIRQHFAPKGHLLRASLYRKQLAARFDARHVFTGLAQNPSAVF